MKNDRGMTPNEILCVSIGMLLGWWLRPPADFAGAAVVSVACFGMMHMWRLLFIPIYRWRDRKVAEWKAKGFTT